jgi:hypothetical protein
MITLEDVQSESSTGLFR